MIRVINSKPDMTYIQSNIYRPMKKFPLEDWATLDTESVIWNKFYTVAPLVVIGTKEQEQYDLAPKHMVTALGHDNYIGFVCTPGHSTYHNVVREEEFTVSYIRPDQIIIASLAATPRSGDTDYEKKIVAHLPTIQATTVDALFIRDSYILMECRLEKIVDGFGTYSLIAGKVVQAYVHKDSLRISERDEALAIQQNPMLAYLPYGRFATIKETLPFPFPRDFIQENLVEPK